MYFIKIDGNFVEFVFNVRKDAIVYIVDYLDRQNFENSVDILKKATKIQTDDTDIIKTDSNTFKIFRMYEYRKCSLCDEPLQSSHTLECEHNVCLSCLSNLRKNECPICREHLSGDVMTDEILCNILQRTELDNQERIQHDQSMALVTQLGYNPNELY